MFTDEEPTHSWQIISEHENKRDADFAALKLNFDDFCRNKNTRWPSKYQRRNPEKFKTEDLQQVVLHVLQNVNAKTGSKNQYWGRGYYIISSDRLKIDRRTKRIPDIHSLIKDIPGASGGTTHDDSENDSSSGSDEDEDEQREDERSEDEQSENERSENEQREDEQSENEQSENEQSENERSDNEDDSDLGECLSD